MSRKRGQRGGESRASNTHRAVIYLRQQGIWGHYAGRVKTALRCHRRGVGRFRRVGGQAAGGSRREGGVARLRPAPIGPELQRAQPAFELKYRDRIPDVVRQTRPMQRDCYACTEFNYKWFANDIEEPYPRRREPSSVGKGACAWWADGPTSGAASVCG